MKSKRPVLPNAPEQARSVSAASPARDASQWNDRPRLSIATILGLAVLSLSAHAASYVVLSLVPAAGPEREDIVVSLEVEEPPPVVEEPPPPEPPPEQPVQPEIAREPEVVPERRRERAPETPPPAAPPPAQEEVPVDFANETLTNDQGSWAIRPSSGESREGPIAVGRNVTGRRVEGVEGGDPAGTGRGPLVVAEAQLARRIQAPNLDDALRRNYPETARAQGADGEVIMRVRIRVGGVASAVRVVRNSAREYRDEFASACRRMLNGSRGWTPPIDATGQPVETEIDYTCTFEIDF